MHSSLLTEQLRKTLGSIPFVDNTTLGALFDGHLALRVEYDSPGERLVCTVRLESPQTPTELSLLRELLRANSWIGSGGATLCLESAGSTVLLLYSGRVTGLDDPRFERLAETLLRMRAAWQKPSAARDWDASSPKHICANAATSATPFRRVEPSGSPIASPKSSKTSPVASRL